ncbi:MAG: MaoC family dehydratase [Anaerolineales bacterium]|nr:MaoC family dehydratase [Anaerolineales bacterium]
MKNFQIGQAATTKRTFTQNDLAEYASLAGIAQTPRVVPEPLLGGMFSYLLGTQLPGRGTNYLKQHLGFPKPAFVGDELLATVEIVRLRPEKNLVNLRTTCTNARGEIVCEGEALVFVKDVA